MKVITYTRKSHHLIARAGWVVLGIALCIGMLFPVMAIRSAQAQGGGQPITVGQVVTGTLNAQTFVQVYRLAASAGDTINLDLTTDTEALAPVVIVNDPDGKLVVQDIDLATPTTATIPDTVLPATGNYTILVMRGTGAEGDASGSYTLRLGGQQQVGGQSITLDQGGISFELVWNAAVNLNLEVRDPVGGSVQWRNPGSPSGGVLDADVNANCDTATANAPSEIIGWPAGSVPAGSYEVIIYYADACDAGGPQAFTLNVTVNGETPQTLTGTINTGQEYLARMILGADGVWSLFNGGVYSGLNVSVFRREIAEAQTVALDSTVSGTITNSAPAQAYTFDGTNGTTVNINLAAQTGSLDTYLVLLGPDGVPLAENDDTTDSKNSFISRNLITDGIYTVIATRFGLNVGGTEGEYLLTFASGATAGESTAGTTGTAATATPSATALPAGAIEIKLQWATNADLRMLVRDPNGDSVFTDIPTIGSGGVLAEDGNLGCTDTTNTPIVYAYWPPSRKPAGTYEIDVWYQDQCEDTTPVNLGLSVVVDGQTVINTSQPISLDNHYLITFTIQADGTVVAGPGGFFDMKDASTLNYQTMLASATPISYGQTVSGSITDQRRFVIYSFQAQQGDQVSIGMEATGGKLDPAVYLIQPEGIQVAFNDDIDAGNNKNSAISKVTLPSSGTYYIIATHYGLAYGGTSGMYNLSLVQD